MPIDHLPRKYRPAAYRLRGFFLTDSMVLIILGLGLLAKGVSYVEVTPTHPHLAERTLSLDVWAAIWMLAGVVSLLGAFIRYERLQAVALGLGVSLNFTWGLSFLVGAIFTDSENWGPCVSYLTVATLAFWAVWRGKRGDVEIQDRGGDAYDGR